MNSRARATRTTLFLAFALAFVMLGLPAFNLGGNDVQLGATGNAEAAIADRIYTVGWIGFLDDFATMNPFLYTMAGEYVVIWSCYSFMLQYDLEGKFMGDLAYNYTVMPDGLTYKFDLARNAYFIDPANPDDLSHPVTWNDVAWTYWQINDDLNNHLHSYFPGIIDDIWNEPGDEYVMYVKTTYPYAPFLGALCSIPILPEYIWSAENPDTFDNLPLVGSGPFYYVGTTNPTTEARLYRNPHWFQEDNRGWQVHDGQFVIRHESDQSTAMVELGLRIIDTYVGVPPSVYLTQIVTGSIPDVKGFAQSTGFVYEFNMNQLSTELRAELGWKGTNNQILLDPVVKEAMQIAIDKPGFVSEVLLDLGTVGDSLVPDVNPWHYAYGLQESEDPIWGRAPIGEEPYAFSTSDARTMLMAAGWAFDSLGNPATGTTVPLYKKGALNGTVYHPLSFRMYSLLPEPEWQLGTDLITEDMAAAGVLLHGDKETDPPAYKQVSQMNSLWYTGDYDCWLWDWFFSPLSEVSADVLSVLTTMEIGSWSDVYWSNATFDELYNRSLQATDPATRMDLTDEMQRMAYVHSGCDSVAYRKELYAVHEGYWMNYGNWEKYFLLMPDQATSYLHTMFYPVDNHAPTLQVPQTYTANINEGKLFTSSAVDDFCPVNDIEFRWFWGDGTKSGWSNAYDSLSHTYAMDGIYTVYVAAKEVGSADGFITWNQTVVTVSDPSNDAPLTVDIVLTPNDPDSGTNVTIEGFATDDEDDDLMYSWDFGDTYGGMGQTTYHQWTEPGSYTLRMSVTDNHIGSGTRPATMSVLVNVATNSPPSIAVSDYTGIDWKKSYTYAATGSDPNSRDVLRYTWDWDDGTISVTDVGSADHTYNQQATFTLTVYLDDLTGLAGHNVSDAGLIEVINPANQAPTITAWTADDATPYTYQTVTFSVTSSDNNDDLRTFTFAFGDGTYYVTQDGGGVRTVTVTADHAYATAGPKTAYVYVNDGRINVTSVALPLTVTANDLPMWLEPLQTVVGTTGLSYDYSASAIELDGDPLTYTWDFGDGSPLEIGIDLSAVSHTYATSGDWTYTVMLSDGIEGHETSQSAHAYMNLPPVLNPLVDASGTAGVSVAFEAVASDPDGDLLVYTWDFGDGSDLEVVMGDGNITHTYAAAGDYTVTVWVDDQYGLPDHNVTDLASVHITPALSDPPVADAGPDQTESGGITVQFDGSGSSDDVGIVSYTWTFTYDGGPVTLTDVDPTYVFWIVGVYEVTLTVVDGDGQSDTDTVQITIPDIIPEFPMLLLPVAGIVILLVGLARRRKQ